MTITTHTAVGTIIGTLVGVPILGFFIGLCSHYLLDMIPHGDSGLSYQFRVEKKRKIPVAYGAIDGVCALLLVLFLANTKIFDNTAIVTASIAGAILPDLVSGLYEVTKSKFLAPIDKFHFYFHDFFLNRRGDVKLRYALAAQSLAVVVWLILLK